MPKSRPQFRLFDLVMWVILAALFFGFARLYWRIPGRVDRSYWSVAYLGIGFGTWFAVWSTIRERRTGPMCQQCGRPFIAQGHLAKSNLCARCRAASLPQQQSRREQTIAWIWILLIVTILMGLIGLRFWNSVSQRFGGFTWIVYPLLALGATLGLLATVIMLIAVVFIVRNLLSQFEKPALARARKTAGEQGSIERSGPLTIWSSAALPGSRLRRSSKAMGRSSASVSST